MKVYLASSFKLIEKVKKVCTVLEAWDHEITEKWWDRPYQVKSLGKIHTSDLKKIYDGLPPHEFYSKPETMMSFDLDYLGVINADAFVFVADSKPRKYNGANVELGIALGVGIPCYYMGVLENSVLYYTTKKCHSYDELLENLEAQQ
jgi:hypothetical protein